MKVEREEKYLQMEEEYQNNQKETVQLKELQKQVEEAENGLANKKEEYRAAWTKSQYEKEELQNKIKL